MAATAGAEGSDADDESEAEGAALAMEGEATSRQDGEQRDLLSPLVFESVHCLRDGFPCKILGKL